MAVSPDKSAIGTAQFEEIKSLRDRLNADEESTSSTLSTIIRTLASGLALLTYNFFASKDHTKFFADNFSSFRLASIFGIAALVADGFQYFFAVRQVAITRRRVIERYKEGKLTVEAFAADRSNIFFIARNALFYLKAAFALAGAIIVIHALWNASPTDLVAAKPSP